jgi:ATP-dependent RNA helicase DHX8/PRP22
MKHLVVTYGKDLSGLHSLEGVRSVGLNPRRQLISVLATSEGLKSIKKCIEEYSPCQGTDQRDFEVDCSACLTSIDDPQELIRLEPCGHAYHTECVEMQLQSGTLTFPIQCASENCSESFLLKDFEYLEKQSKFKIKELISASLKCYLQMNTDKHKSCPTPDCEMIYAKTDDGKEFTCSDCGLITCTTCDESHPGITCHMNKAARFGHEEFERWIKANAKKCPKCSVPIEKDGGCNHVICRLCRAHICWVCLNIFETDQHCYAHLRTECAMYP